MRRGDPDPSSAVNKWMTLGKFFTLQNQRGGREAKLPVICLSSCLSGCHDNPSIPSSLGGWEPWHRAPSLHGRVSGNWALCRAAGQVSWCQLLGRETKCSPCLWVGGGAVFGQLGGGRETFLRRQC